MTNPSTEQRVRTRCRATTKHGVQCRSTAVSDIDGLCSLHGGRLNPVEIGRKGGKARGKSKAGSFREALRRTLERDPERHAQKLLDSGAAGMRLASELLEAEEAAAKVEAEKAGPIEHDGRAIVGLPDLIAFAMDIGQLETALGSDLLARIREGGGGRGVPESDGTPVPSRDVLPSTPAPVSLQDPSETEKHAFSDAISPADLPQNGTPQ